MKTFRLYLLLLLVACSWNTWATPPKRIISLVPSVTKNIYQLGAQNELVGCTSFCTLAKPTDAQVVASAVKVNIEKVLLLKPDLIITGTLTPQESIAMFKKMGIAMLHLPYPKSFHDICDQMLVLGDKIGKKEEAERLVRQAQEELNMTRTKLPKQTSKPTVFMQIGANPLFGVVPNTFMNEFLSYANCQNIAEDMQTGTISREAILLRNPDYIFVVIMGSMGKDESKNWEKYSQLKAVQQKHIFELNADKACSPTPDDFVSILKEIINRIYN